jgi:hypothetical protein
VVRVNRGKRNAAVVHLTGENFITGKPISKNTAVTVWTEQTFLSRDIWQVAKHRLHTVVLLLHVVEMIVILIDCKVAEDSLQQQEGVEVLMVPVWSIVENTNT